MENKNQWSNKCWSAYGDSITAITNGNNLTTGWAKYVNEYHEFSQFYGRGIGGQSFAYGENGGSVSFINEEGIYHSRSDLYHKDNYTGEIPDGCVAVRGSFCSWDRITHMYPETIKDTIDMVYIMGGTNDAVNDADAVWIENNTTDVEWSESEFYLGGDYNITTLKGGVASTVMKFQAWMPNAVIVIGTPLSSRGIAGENGVSLDVVDYDKSQYIKEVANRLSLPVIDVYGTCGINPLNRTTYIQDGVHPYLEAGKMMLGRTVAMGLINILPKF